MDKGFTLVEIVVSMMITSITIAAILVYNYTGIKSYKNSKAETMALLEERQAISHIVNNIKRANDFRYDNTADMSIIQVVTGDSSDIMEYRPTLYSYILDKSSDKLYIVQSDWNGSFYSAEDASGIKLDKKNLLCNGVNEISLSEQSIQDMVGNNVKLKVSTGIDRYQKSEEVTIKFRNEYNYNNVKSLDKEEQ